MQKIAIIGAGLAGLTLVSQLQQLKRKYSLNLTISLFEKSRGVGGRMATRRSDEFSFDHGAQYFTARTPQFQQFLSPFIADGTIQPWHARYKKFTDSSSVHSVDCQRDGSLIRSETTRSRSESLRYVAAPNMNSLAKKILSEFDNDVLLHLNTRITQLKQTDYWHLIDESGHIFENFDWVFITAPAPQAIELLPTHFNAYETIQSTQMEPCLALMLGFDDLLDFDFDCAHVDNSIISWIAMNHTKPNRSALSSLVIHSSNQYAKQFLAAGITQEAIKNQISAELLHATEILLSRKLPVAKTTQLHLWRYASNSNPALEKSYLDTQLKLGVCGDWCFGGRVEGAFSSADNLVNQFLEQHDF